MHVFNARLDSQCKVVLPTPVREKLGVGPGDEIVFAIEDGRVLLSNGRSILERLDEFVGPIWQGYAEEVQRDRDEWDR
jgi:AbrB family looped-hinge helix DNA binding protein